MAEQIVRCPYCILGEATEPLSPPRSRSYSITSFARVLRT